MRIIASGGYPWDAIPDIGYAWIADARFMDNAALGVWKPAKGTVQRTQGTAGNKPAFGAGWATGNYGMVTYDGVDDYLVADAIAPLISPTKPFTFIESFQALSAPTSGQTVWSFGGSGAASTIAVLQGEPAGSVHPWRLIYYDDAGNIKYTQQTTPVAADTSKVIITGVFNGSVWTTFRINRVPVSFSIASVPGVPLGAANFTKATCGAHRGASLSQFIHKRERGGCLALKELSTSAILAVENFFASQAA